MRRPFHLSSSVGRSATSCRYPFRKRTPGCVSLPAPPSIALRPAVGDAGFMAPEESGRWFLKRHRFPAIRRLRDAITRSPGFCGSWDKGRPLQGREEYLAVSCDRTPRVRAHNVLLKSFPRSNDITCSCTRVFLINWRLKQTTVRGTAVDLASHIGGGKRKVRQYFP